MHGVSSDKQLLLTPKPLTLEAKVAWSLPSAVRPAVCDTGCFGGWRPWKLSVLRMGMVWNYCLSWTSSCSALDVFPPRGRMPLFCFGCLLHKKAGTEGTLRFEARDTVIAGTGLVTKELSINVCCGTWRLLASVKCVGVWGDGSASKALACKHQDTARSPAAM